ncbi:hypothetical protein [Staphylococcus capitis]|nr:hypothetical protein [Staphylococcus capitis]
MKEKNGFDMTWRKIDKSSFMYVCAGDMKWIVLVDISVWGIDYLK